jgi:hypothetical protein
MLNKNTREERFRWMELFGPSAVLVIVVLVLGTLAISAALPAEPTAATILDGYIEATGGLEAYDKIRNRVVESELVIEGAGITLTGTVYAARPNLTYTRFHSDMIGTTETGSDGTVVWEKNAMSGPQLVEGAQREFMLREGRLDKLTAWREAYPGGAELDGTVEVDGTECYKVVLNAGSGKPVVLYFHPESRLMVRQDITVETPMGEVPLESYISDYREVDGVLLPFKVRIAVAGQTRVMTTTSVKHNVDLPEDRFTAPEDVLALITPAEVEAVTE